MAYAPAAPDLERLPWLNDDIKAPPKDELRPLLVWSLVAALLIGAASYWLGLTNSPFSSVPAAPAGTAASTTIDLPAPFTAEPLVDDVGPAPMPEVRPVAAPSVSLPTRHRDRPRRAQRRAVLERTPLPDENLREVVGKQEAAKQEAAEPQAEALTEKETEKASAPLQLWPAAISENAHGRVVRIGTFGSRLKAKRAWHRVVRAYPGMRRLKATVVANPSLRNGRTYYRLQFGTTSQAHSTVLCQWMRNIGQSCVVVGLPQGVA